MLTSEKKIKTSSQPNFFVIRDRVNSFRKTVTIAMPVNTHAMTLMFTPRFSWNCASVSVGDEGALAMVEV
jgi:hypothetical protein